MSDSPVIAFINKATDLILLNFIWIICCIPVFTIGAATSAMYYVCIISIRQGDGYVVRRFFKAFKENFAKSTIVWLCILVLVALGIVDVVFWTKMGGSISRLMIAVSVAILIIILMICEYIYPVMAKFEGDIKTCIKNAAAMAVGYLPYTVVILVIDAVAVIVNLKTVAANVVMVFVGFALITYVKSFLFYKVFMNHMDERFDDFEREKRLDEAMSSGDTEEV